MKININGDWYQMIEITDGSLLILCPYGIYKTLHF